MNFLNNIKELVKKISKDRRLICVEFQTYPPLSILEIEHVFGTYQTKMDEHLCNFYQQTNGLKLRWQLNPTMSDADFDEIFSKNSSLPLQLDDDDANPFAHIDILPLPDLIKANLANYAFEGDIDINGSIKKMTEIGQKMFIFDKFSEFECVAIYLDTTETHLLLLSNYYDDWRSTRLTNFKSYEQMLLASKGISDARRSFLAQSEGTKFPPLIWQKIDAEKFNHNLLANL